MTIPAPRADGRWRGAITSRPLPDGIGEGLDVAMRERLARVWFTQAATELRVAHAFEVVHASLSALGADRGLIAVAERGIDDEHRHAALCLEVAERYADHRDLPAVPELPFAHPSHPEARDEVERQVLFVIGQCCFNETFASAYLSLSRSLAVHPLPRAALSELLSDEIDHARIGWALLTTLAPERRAALGRWMVPLARANLRAWRAIRAHQPTDLEAHGVPAPDAIEAALVEALGEVIVPGLSRSDVDVAALAAWVAGGAPT